MPSQSQRGRSIRQWTSHDEVVIPQHQNSDHLASTLNSGIGNGPPDGEVIDYLLWEQAGILPLSNCPRVLLGLPLFVQLVIV
jgi:hypothetical protein